MATGPGFRHNPNPILRTAGLNTNSPSLNKPRPPSLGIRANMARWAAGLVLALTLITALACGGEEAATESVMEEAPPNTTEATRNTEAAPGAAPTATSPVLSQTRQRSPARTQGAQDPTETALTSPMPQPSATKKATETPLPRTTEPPATPTPTTVPTPEGPPCFEPKAAAQVKMPPAQTSAETDKAALEALFNATDGERWETSQTWMTRRPLMQWHGVSTNDQGRVTELSLTSVRGELPPELGNLTELEVLILSNSSVTLPPEFGNLTKLERFGLIEESSFGDHLIPEWGNLVNLRKLDFSGMNLEGAIPVELGNLTNLQSLNLADNRLCGELPGELGNLASLSLLNLSGNKLSGEIPSSFRGLTGVTWMYLSNNLLSGELPPWLLNLPRLSELRLSNNQLSGELPPELDYLATVRVFLQGNPLEGCVSQYMRRYVLGESIHLEDCTPADNPEDVETLIALDPYLPSPRFADALTRRGSSLLPEIGGVYVDTNGHVAALEIGFGREIPALLGDLSHLRVLRIAYSDGAQLPEALGNLSHLRVLTVNNAEMTGPLPDSLANLRNLRVLNLRANEFTGEIPAFLGNLPNLRELWVGHNNFTGCVPKNLAENPHIKFRKESALPTCP